MIHSLYWWMRIGASATRRDATLSFLEPRRRASSFAFAFVRSARAQCCPPPYAPFKPEKICGVAPSLEYIERNVRRTT